MDIKDDKSLWEPMNLEGVGKVLLVEESYYDSIVEEIENYKKVVYILERHNEQSQEMFNRVHDELEKAQELIKLLYNEMGGSADGDHALWMKTKEYCFKNKLISYEK
jgi:hypothetical protein